MLSQNEKPIQTPLNNLREFCKTYQLEDPSQEFEKGFLDLIESFGQQLEFFAGSIWYVKNCCPRFILDTISAPTERTLANFKIVYAEARQKFITDPKDNSVL